MKCQPHLLNQFLISKWLFRAAVAQSMAISAASFVGGTSAAVASATTAAMTSGATATTIGATTISATTALVSYSFQMFHPNVYLRI